MGRRQHPDPGARFRFDETACRQRLDGFADHRAARPEFAAKIGLDRKGVLRLEIAADDSGAQLFDDMGKKIAFLRPSQRQSWMLGHGAINYLIIRPDAANYPCM